MQNQANSDLVEKMKCVFFDENSGKCYAEMSLSGVQWKVDEETKKKFCTLTMFTDCPRFEAKMEVLTKSK